MKEGRDEGGRFTQQHTDTDVIAAVRAHEPAGTSEVAGELGIARQSADYRLRRLRDTGAVASKKIGASLVWFTTDESGRQRPETLSERLPDPSPPDVESADQDVTTPELDAALADVLEGWPPAGQGKREQRRQAGRAALEWLRDVGEATARDFREHVEPEHPVDGQSPKTWWRKAARPALTRARDTGVVEFVEGSKVYRWAGDRE